MTFPLRRLALAFALAVGLTAPAAGQSPYTWQTPAGGTWNTAANWRDAANNAVVPVSDPTTQLIFNADGTVSYTATNDIGPFTLNRLTFNNTGTGTITIAGSAPANTLTFAGTDPTIDVTAGSVLFTALLAGSPTVTKTGAGTFIHDSNNSGFTGTLNVNGGTFINRATVTTPANFNPVSIVVNAGGTYQFGENTAGDPNLPNATYITVNTGGTVNWQEGETFGGLHLQGGTINFQQGGVTSSGATPQSWTSGTLTGGAFNVAGNTAINKTTSGTVTISGGASVTTGTGGFNIQDGTVAHVAAGNLGTSNIALGAAATAGTFEYQGATATRGGAFTVNGGGGTIRVTTPGTTLTLTGAVSGSGPLSLDGPGTVVLAGALNQTGTTTVAAGTLRVNPVTSAGGFALAAGTTLAVAGGAGTASFSVPTLSLPAGGATLRFELNAAGLPSAPLLVVTTADGLTLNGGTHTLAVTNAQTFAIGTNQLIDYSGTGITGGFTVVLPGRTAGSLVFNTTDTRIDLSVTGTDTIKWGGQTDGTWDVGTAPGVGGTPNWRLVSNNNSTNFIDTDTVTFDDTAGGNFTITIPGSVQPAAVTVNNSTNTYTFQGPGGIAGTTGLVKQGTGTLVVATDNTYTGPTTVTAGTLQIGSGGTTGAVPGNIDVAAGTTLAFNRDGTLVYTGVISGTGPVTVAGPGVVSLEASNTNTGTVTVNGGTLRVADNGLGGDLDASLIVVDAGGRFEFVGPAGNADLPGGTVITVNTGGVVEFTEGEDYGAFNLLGGAYNSGVNNNLAQTTVLESGTITGLPTGSLAGAGLIRKATAGTVTITGVALNNTGGLDIEEGVLSTDAAIGGSGTINIGVTAPATFQYRGPTGAVTRAVALGEGGGTIDVTQAGTAVTLSGAVSGTGALTKQGPGTLVLSGGTNTYAGTTTIAAGTLRVTNTAGSATGTGAVAVNNTATLDGTGTIAGPVTLNAGGTLQGGTGGASAADVLTLSGGLTLSGANTIRTVVADTTVGNGIAEPAGSRIELGAGTLTGTDGLTTVRLSAAPNTLDFGQQYTVTVAQFAAVSNLSLTNFTIDPNPEGFVFAGAPSLDLTATALTITFTPAPEPGAALAMGAVTIVAGLTRRARRQPHSATH